MHEYQFNSLDGDNTVFNVYMDKEDLKAGDLVVIGSTIYKVDGVTEMEDGVAVFVNQIGDKLYVGMLSEW